MAGEVALERTRTLASAELDTGKRSRVHRELGCVDDQVTKRRDEAMNVLPVAQFKFSPQFFIYPSIPILVANVLELSISTPWNSFAVSCLLFCADA